MTEDRKEGGLDVLISTEVWRREVVLVGQGLVERRDRKSLILICKALWTFQDPVEVALEDLILIEVALQQVQDQVLDLEV